MRLAWAFTFAPQIVLKAMYTSRARLSRDREQAYLAPASTCAL